MSQNWSSKRDLRSHFLDLCKQEFARGLVQEQQQLNSQLRDFLKSRSGLWGAYRGLPSEAHVEEIFKISHLKWVFPRMIGSKLEFFEAQEFEKGAFGVWEPILGSQKRELEDIQGILIPGVSFNRNGCRLGKGKGFYDQSLAQFQGLKVGVCFEFQTSHLPLPVENHDIVMDFLITEKDVYDCGKLRSVR